MILIIECIILCLLFTLMVYIVSREPIKTLYNYPPKIQEKVKLLKKYKNKIPTENNKVMVKVLALIVFLGVLCLILRYINGYTAFLESFIYGYFLWTVVNLYDLIVLDIIWFCHDPYFIFEGTEDMKEEYHNYWFHIKGFLIGEGLALIVCLLSGLIIQFVL